MSAHRPQRAADGAQQSVALRSGLLFINFFLILLAYYLIKPARSGIFLEYLDAEHLPYIWIGSAITMAILINPYRYLVNRYSRLRVVVASCAIYILALVILWRWAAEAPGPKLAISLYLFADIFGVVLLEQFWSLTNSTYRTHEGTRWYGLVGSGALIGGMFGGGFSSWLVGLERFETGDLLYIAALFIWIIMMMTITLIHLGVYQETTEPAHEPPLSEDAGIDKPAEPVARSGWRAIFSSTYMLLITGILLLSQFAQPIVDFQFMSYVEQNFDDVDSRTGFLSIVVSLIGGVALAINLIITPLILRFCGTVVGLYAQPVLLGAAVMIFIQVPTLAGVVLIKITDRALSYSINRASKELLYVPVPADVIFRAKAWIDMFGFRVFKILGAGVVILFTSDELAGLHNAHLAWVVLAICIAWGIAVRAVGIRYRARIAEEKPAAEAA